MTDTAPKPAADKPEAQPAEDAKSVGRTANDFMIPLSSSANKDWQGKEEAFHQHAVEVAKGLYPTLAPQLDAGVTTKTLVDPYVQVAKSVLGPDTEPDFSQPKWAKALEGGQDPKTGRPTLMPLTAWRDYLQNDPSHGYDKTPQANERAQGFAQALHQSFQGAG